MRDYTQPTVHIKRDGSCSTHSTWQVVCRFNAHISHTSCRAYCLEDIQRKCFSNSTAFTLLCSVRQMLALIKRLFHTLLQNLIQTQYTEPQISNNVRVLVRPAVLHISLFCFCLPLPLLQHSCCSFQLQDIHL